MRRWNGWGDDTVEEALPERAKTLLGELVGPSSRPLDASLGDIVAAVPPSRVGPDGGLDLDPLERVRHAPRPEPARLDRPPQRAPRRCARRDRTTGGFLVGRGGPGEGSGTRLDARAVRRRQQRRRWRDDPAVGSAGRHGRPGRHDRPPAARRGERPCHVRCRHVRAAIIGFGDVHTRAHLYRAILEGLAYALRDGAERTASRTGVPLTSLRIAGGGSQSPAAVQLTADIFGLPVAKVHTHETSGLGAAIDAAVGLGLHSDVRTAVAAMVRVGEVRDPDPAKHAIYDELFRDVYRRMYPRLQPLYRSIKRIIGYPSV